MMPPRLSKVKYLHEEDIDVLNKKVSTRLRTGWELAGPLMFENSMWIQILIKFTQKPVKGVDLQETNQELN